MNQQPDKLFKQRLEHYQKSVPSTSWNRVQANLGKKKHNHIFLKIAAALLLLAAAFILLQVYKGGNTQPLVAENNVTPQRNTQDPEKQKVSEVPASGEINSVEPATQPQSELKSEKPLRRPARNQKTKKTAAVKEVEEVSMQQITALKSEPEVEDLPQITIIQEEPIVAMESEENNSHDVESESITLVYTASEVNEKYLNKKTFDEATSEEKKTSTLRKLLDKAYDLKHNQDPFGELRQKKNEILAFNFKNDKQRNQNK